MWQYFQVKIILVLILLKIILIYVEVLFLLLLVVLTPIDNASFYLLKIIIMIA